MSHGLKTGDTVVYAAGGGLSIGGLENGKTYFVIFSSPTTVQLAATYQDAEAGIAIDLTSAGTGSGHQLLAGAVALANSGRDTIASRSPGGKVSGATSASTGLSSGTTAAIDTGVTIDAGSVGVHARQKFDLDTLTGGVGLGLGAGLGLGIAVVLVDADVSAFIAPGTTINGLSGTGTLSVDAQLNSTVRSLGFAGAASGFISLGSAVSVVNDTSDVRALLGARVNNSGNIEEASSAAGRAVIGGENFDNVRVDADSDRTLRIATGAGFLTLSPVFNVGLGAAITVANASGRTEALIGDYTQVGVGPADRVGSVSVLADGTLSVRPFQDGDPMGIALGGAFLALTASVTDVTLGGDPSTTYVRAEIGDHASVYASGDVQVSALSQWQAIVTADGAAFGAIGVGVMVARAEVSGQTRSRIGTGATVYANSLDVTANGEAAANVRTVAASGGIISGRGSVATATILPTVASSIAGGAVIHLTGNLSVLTDYLAEGDATARGYGGGVIDAGVSQARSTVNPTAIAVIENGAQIDSVGPTGGVTVRAQRKSLAAQLTDAIVAVDETNDTLRYGDFEFGEGDVLEYDTNGSAIGGLADGREYYVLTSSPAPNAPNGSRRVDLTLGVRFSGSTEATTSDGTTLSFGLNPNFDTIVFAGPHNLLTGDAVVYDGGDAPVGIRNLDGSQTSLQAGLTYYVRKIDERTIKLFSTQAQALKSWPGRLLPEDQSELGHRDDHRAGKHFRKRPRGHLPPRRHQGVRSIVRGCPACRHQPQSRPQHRSDPLRRQLKRDLLWRRPQLPARRGGAVPRQRRAGPGQPRQWRNLLRHRRQQPVDPACRQLFPGGG